MGARYVPERGDVVWLCFDPQAGHEQAGHRPALTLSPRAYNAKAGLALFCPITSQSKGYPFEVTVRSAKLQGVVLADQIRNLDWRARQARFCDKVSALVIDEVLAKLATLVGAG